MGQYEANLNFAAGAERRFIQGERVIIEDMDLPRWESFIRRGYLKAVEPEGYTRTVAHAAPAQAVPGVPLGASESGAPGALPVPYEYEDTGYMESGPVTEVTADDADASGEDTNGEGT